VLAFFRLFYVGRAAVTQREETDRISRVKFAIPLGCRLSAARHRPERHDPVQLAYPFTGPGGTNYAFQAASFGALRRCGKIYNLSGEGFG
jgi:hypothetical protein